MCLSSSLVNYWPLQFSGHRWVDSARVILKITEASCQKCFCLNSSNFLQISVQFKLSIMRRGMLSLGRCCYNFYYLVATDVKFFTYLTHLWEIVAACNSYEAFLNSLINFIPFIYYTNFINVWGRADNIINSYVIIHFEG